MPPYERSHSNEIAASSNRLDQLRRLQSQLGMLIQDTAENSFDMEEIPMEHSTRSTLSGSSSWERFPECDDIETGLSPLKQKRLQLLQSTSSASDETLLISHQQPSTSPSAEVPSSTTSLRATNGLQSSFEISSRENKSFDSSEHTHPTISSKDSNSNGDSNNSRKSHWSRSQGSTRSLPRSLSQRIFLNSKKELSPVESSLPDYDFFQKDEEEGKGGNLRPGAKWWHGILLFSSISVLACIVTLWAPYPMGARMPTDIVANMPWSNGCQGLRSCICPRETICADDLTSMILLTIARCTAWFDYPLYMTLFLSKASNLNNYLQKTALRCWINFSDTHRVHSLFGVIVGIESTSHGFLHILRWARRNDDIQLLWNSKTGITGIIALMCCPIIVLPMAVPYIKKRMSFEWRKGLHFLSIIWGAALMCHAPQRIFWLIGIPVFIYTADKVVEVLFKTHLLESAHFQRLGETSCIISFENPAGFGRQNSAYVYLMLPWLSRSQFHAFTIFPCTKPNHSSICISKCGDWTEKLMKALTTPTHKPAFIVGPFLSPFSSPAMDSEHLVAVASGIGVTPAISLIKQYSSTSRRLNLVWICRDAGLVEHFLHNVNFGTTDGFTLVYYTGKRPVILNNDLPANIFLFNGRPDLERTIIGIIASIATGEGLPEELHQKVVARTPSKIRSKLLLEKALTMYSMNQLFDYTVKASKHYNENLDLSAAAVSYKGVLSTMKHLLGDDFDLVMDQIAENFHKIDAGGHCCQLLDREEFEAFFDLMLLGSTAQEQSSMANVRSALRRSSTCRDMFESSRDIPTNSGDPDKWKAEFDVKTHLKGDGKYSKKNWKMLYCGGSQPVLDQLKAFKRKFGIGLSVEKFDW